MNTGGQRLQPYWNASQLIHSVDVTAANKQNDETWHIKETWHYILTTPASTYNTYCVTYACYVSVYISKDVYIIYILQGYLPQTCIHMGDP